MAPNTGFEAFTKHEEPGSRDWARGLRAMCVDKVASVRYRLYFDRGLTRALDSYCNNVYAVVLPVTYGRCVVP